LSIQDPRWSFFDSHPCIAVFFYDLVNDFPVFKARWVVRDVFWSITLQPSFGSLSWLIYSYPDFLVLPGSPLSCVPPSPDDHFKFSPDAAIPRRPFVRLKLTGGQHVSTPSFPLLSQGASFLDYFPTVAVWSLRIL